MTGYDGYDLAYDLLAAAVKVRFGLPKDATSAALIEALDSPAICGQMCPCGPNGELLACGYSIGHQPTDHSWATLPTWPAAPSEPEPPALDAACSETASAPTNHYVTAETFGHVCLLPRTHSYEHECRCGYRWLFATAPTPASAEEERHG